jgi:hypothetical protein
MANYPAPPHRRVAFDREDVQAVAWDDTASGVTELTVSNLQALNDEDDDTFTVPIGSGVTPNIGYLAFVFPFSFKCNNIKVVMHTATSLSGIALERSDDTTNGRDGTWTVETGAVSFAIEAARPNYRNAIVTVSSATARKGWRLKCTDGSPIGQGVLRAVHLYGQEFGPANRVSFWDGTLNQELAADIDFGDRARGTIVDRTFRIKNVSALTANTVAVAVEQGPSYGSASGWTLLSLTLGSGYASSVSLGNLAAGVISPVIHMRANVPTNAEVDALTFRLTPSVASFT